MDSRKKILVIDDEEDIRTYLEAFLSDNGFEVVLAADGKEGVEKAAGTLPALITLDISMPEESGVKALRELQSNENTSRIPVVIITGVSPDLEGFLSRRKQVHPPDAFIEKPVDKKKLLETINRLLKGSEN